MHANQREEIKEVRAGDIAAAVGLKEAVTGDTLCDPRKIITLERIVFPEPVIHVAVEPKTKVDQEKMGLALNRLAQEDPSFRVRTDEESGQTIISGMGELHLEIIVERMKREFGVEANVGAPQVAYREAIRKLVESEGKFIKQSGGRGQYGHVWLKMEPYEAGKGFEFVDAIKGGAVPREFIPAVEKGLRDTLPNGVLAGFPVVDVKVTLFDGSFHNVDSNENAFKMAASMAFKDGMRKASPVLLEPMMAVEVETPAVEKGLRDTLPNGVLAGFPVVDVKVTLFDGSYHNVDSNENAFKMAASMAFKDGMRKASPVLLEPMMAVEVETPADFMGNVVGDLSSRRGMIQGMDDLPGLKVISAEVPLAEMFGYSTSLRSATQGRATYTMEFKRYSEAPKSVAEAVINKK